MRGYSPTTPTGGFPYGAPGMANMNSAGFPMQQAPQRYSGGYNQMPPDAPNMGMMTGNPPNMVPRYNMPPGTYNRGTRMEHVANSTLNNRSFGAV